MTGPCQLVILRPSHLEFSRSKDLDSHDRFENDSSSLFETFTEGVRRTSAESLFVRIHRVSSSIVHNHFDTCDRLSKQWSLDDRVFESLNVTNQSNVSPFDTR